MNPLREFKWNNWNDEEKNWDNSMNLQIQEMEIRDKNKYKEVERDKYESFAYVDGTYAI